MLHSRIERESIEDSGLAPAACRSAASRGRKYPEPPHSYRSEFQRDRDRVIHCRAFRRLEYKTQVFVNGTADHYRTRLTHTIEMAAVGRTMARALRLNEDLTEAIALAHDIGHSPFGHSGEYALNELMKDHGGFDHNVQSLRWVEQLERRYPDFPGLNLTWETRAGLRKHLAQAPGAELDGTAIGPFQCLEAQVADVADDLTYHAHDVDDGLEAGLLNEEMLDSLELWREAARLVRQQYGRLGERERLAMTVRGLLDIQVQDALDHTAGRLARHRPQSPDEAMRVPERIVAFSDGMAARLKPFRAFLSQNVYYHPDVARDNNEAVELMRGLFLYYVEHPEAMGRRARARIPEDGLWRAACDYVSGMTDRYALDEVRRFGLG